jgi:hypothetical protein
MLKPSSNRPSRVAIVRQFASTWGHAHPQAVDEYQEEGRHPTGRDGLVDP